MENFLNFLKNRGNSVKNGNSLQDNEIKKKVMPEIKNDDNKSQTFQNTAEPNSKDTYIVGMSPIKTNKTLVNTINAETGDNTSSDLDIVKKILSNTNITVKRINVEDLENVLPTHVILPENTSNSIKDAYPSNVREYKTTNDNLSDRIETIGILEDSLNAYKSTDIHNTRDETTKCLSEFDRILAELQINENVKATNYKALTVEDDIEILNEGTSSNSTYELHDDGNTYKFQDINTSSQVQSLIQDTEILHSIFGNDDISKLLEMDVNMRSHDLVGPKNVVENKGDVISISSESDDDLIPLLANKNFTENDISSSESYINLNDVAATKESISSSTSVLLNDIIILQFINAPKTYLADSKNNTKILNIENDVEVSIFNTEFHDESKLYLDTILINNKTNEINESHLKTISISCEEDDAINLFDSQINDIFNLSDDTDSIVREIEKEMSSDLKENTIKELDSKQISVEDSKENVKHTPISIDNCFGNISNETVLNETQNSVVVNFYIKEEDEETKTTEKNNLDTILEDPEKNYTKNSLLKIDTGYVSDDCGYHSSDFEFITEDEARKVGLFTNSNNQKTKRTNKRKIKLQTQSYRVRNEVQDDPYAPGPSQRYTEQHENREVTTLNQNLNNTMENVPYSLRNSSQNDPYGPGPSSIYQGQLNDAKQETDVDECYKVPSESEFLNIFRDMPPIPISEIHYLENKSLWTRVPMLVQYEGVGFDVSLALNPDEGDTSDEDREEARRTRRIMLDMYPEDNS